MQYIGKDSKEIITCTCGKNEFSYVGTTTNPLVEGVNEQYSYVFKCQNPKCLRQLSRDEDFEEIVEG